MPNKERKLRGVLIGSLRFTDQINQTIELFEANGIPVLAPRRGALAKEVGEFRVLDSDGEMSPREIERGFLQALFSADFGYIINKDGYIGKTSSMEVGLAMGHGIPLYAMEEFNYLDEHARGRYIGFAARAKVYPPAELIKMVKTGKLDIQNLSWYRARRPKISPEKLDVYTNLVFSFFEDEIKSLEPWRLYILNQGNWQTVVTEEFFQHG